MEIHEHVPLGPKTTMRIGGTARYFADLRTQRDVKDVVVFAEEKQLPLVMLGGGSNTIFADGTVEAVVARVTADGVDIEYLRPTLPSPPPEGEGIIVHVQTGKILASLLNELAEQNLDLSPLTGIPGIIGGAMFGNAGQGFEGTWIGSFVKDVTFYHEKQWKTFSQKECEFSYRDSIFKHWPNLSAPHLEPRPQGEGTRPPIIWATTLSVPFRPKEKILADIDAILRRRIETQPHMKTAGSCFKNLPDGTPAWKLIDAARFRGHRVGDIQVAEKHANFLLNTGKATFADATALVRQIQSRISKPLNIEMRFIGSDGSVIF
ncbi:hypothetical protein A3H22_02495 [Candidatus Peribacteria bacterium RIFCSPLOWO2_12_FULL_55_15]|nr:MAG: hypothetical protein A2789_02910 [Candidatus Peribacteria bacterium RIFCSPHIGHO2_01_FULL_54_22]OGJ62901.1 MAG: hypothetical protein A3D12_01145 [Candidatus Peribacteria bacterium RIFCSPHIGHO2_02_FULL_55_24]OGJ65097.1 MAG: hypothetical protein A3E47_02075 [Candidatus Peribacteria bacterium RIFCSPHIGHO2_12_FULL_54_10]OGJ67287.1 MAG: hypothetical protein A2947_01155 [Candidatus Peribacteria bacterium RIFCSPLOWO2_01_FULL_54_110]OGJ70019.1 MAG: hypothetical protein A3H90_03660 [Candidatus Pe